MKFISSSVVQRVAGIPYVAFMSSIMGCDCIVVFIGNAFCGMLFCWTLVRSISVLLAMRYQLIPVGFQNVTEDGYDGKCARDCRCSEVPVGAVFMAVQGSACVKQ